MSLPLGQHCDDCPNPTAFVLVAVAASLPQMLLIRFTPFLLFTDAAECQRYL